MQRSQDKVSKFFTGVFVAAVMIDVARMFLGFFPRFEGTGETRGFADDLFGRLTFGGFRSDFVWLVLSSLAIACISLALIANGKSKRPLVILGFAEVTMFFIYLGHSLLSGLLDFG